MTKFFTRSKGKPMSNLHIFGTLAAAGGGGGGSPATEFDVTIASGTVSADLTDFPVMVDMNDMPPAFWLGVRSDGGNIRAYQSDGTTPIPIDVTYIDVNRGLGRMFIKHSVAAASDTVFKIKIESPATTALAVTDPNGRNAVWSDFEVVWVFPSTENRTGKGYTQGGVGPVEQSKWIRDGYYDMPGNPHQGLAVDTAGNLVTIDTNYLRRHTTSNFVTVLASNSNPILAVQTETGDVDINHLSDGCIISGEVWIPANQYPNSGLFNEYLCVFDMATLALNRTYNVSAVGRHVSSICYNPADGVIYATDYTNGASLMKFDTSGNYLGTVALSTTLSLLQGIEVVNGKFYLSVQASENPIYEVEFDGTVNGVIFNNPQSGINGGISFASGTLYHMDGDGDLTVLRMESQFADWARIHYQCMYSTYPRSTVFTMSTSVYWVDPTGDIQQAFASMANGTTSSQRATLAHRTASNRIGLWNSVDSWLESDVDPNYKDVFRVSAKHDNSAQRKLFVNGVLKATDDTISARPSGSGTSMDFVLNASDISSSEDGEGYYQFAWSRSEYMSDAWMAADAANMNNPSAFYSIVAA